METLILIIDDDRDTADSVWTTLCAPDRRVALARDGSSGLRMARRLLPDLVVLDLKLPRIPGVTVCRKLREDPVMRRIPIVVLSGRVEVEDKIRLLRVGADDYVSKPFDPEELRARVAAVLRRAGRPVQGAAQMLA